MISPNEVIRLAKAGEGAHVEFKRRLPRHDRIARTLCAFANTSGGTLLVGVTDVGDLHGVDRAAEVAQALETVAAHSVEPEVAVETAIVPIRSAPIVVCTVPESELRPHAVVDSAGERDVMVRVGASNRRASASTKQALTRQVRRAASLAPLERLALAWVQSESQWTAQPGGTATVQGFARKHNIGATRASRAFEHLVRDGYLVAHGRGRTRIYAPAGTP